MDRVSGRISVHTQQSYPHNIRCNNDSQVSTVQYKLYCTIDNSGRKWNCRPPCLKLLSRLMSQLRNIPENISPPHPLKVWSSYEGSGWLWKVLIIIKSVVPFMGILGIARKGEGV